MIHLAIDHVDPVSNRPMPNGIPLSQHHLIETMDGRRLDYPRIFYYLRQCNIPTKIVYTDSAPRGAWYPLVLGWFDFDCDYLQLISSYAYKKIKQGQMLLLFTYHEGDHPGHIRQRLNDLCSLHGINHDVVWFLSGNSSADSVPGCIYWPELEFMYWRTVNLASGTEFHTNTRTRKFTALCRIDKLWRKVFMSQLWQKNLHNQGYFSYNQVDLGTEDDYYQCALSNEYLAQQQSLVDRFIKAGPFRVDDLDHDSHNRYDVNMNDLYSDSYFNIVLETMIDVDGSGGVFVTEKTFKPIFNNQFFVEVAAADTLAHLRDLGYQTFARCIDESYDSIHDNQQRFQSVLDLTIKLSSMPMQQLHDLYTNLQPEIVHNSEFFKSGMAQRLQSVAQRLSSIL